MKRLFLLSLVIAVLGWAAWYFGPGYERGRESRKPHATAGAVAPGGGDVFYLAEEDGAGSGWEFLGIGMCCTALFIATAAVIVWVQDKTGGR